jgi:molecular chaperone GrpE
VANETKDTVHEGEVHTSPSQDQQDQEVQEAQAREGELEEAQDEVDILRAELARMQDSLGEAERQRDEFKDRYLRARAELENYRRRVQGDLERAREAGVDSAVLAVLPVYDDLGRALQAATDDPSRIISGVESVREGLKRNLEALGIKEVGKRGEVFDPDFHEALSSFPAEDEALAGTVAEVYQVGFTKDDRLVRPARVVVYQG